MWINTTTLKVYTLHSDIRAELSRQGVSLPDIVTDAVLAPLCYAPVAQVTPVFDPATQKATQVMPAIIGGVWTQVWAVSNLTGAQLAAKQAFDKDMHNAPIKAQIAALDLKRIRPLAEGDTAFLAGLNTQITTLRAQLQ